MQIRYHTPTSEKQRDRADNGALARFRVRVEKCRKHSPAAPRVFYISLVFSNFRRVLSQCNTRLRLLYLIIN